MTPEEFKIELLPLKNKLFRISWHLLGQREEAEDVVQEVYLKAWDMRHRMEKYKSTEGLLVTMTRNRCLDKLRQRKNQALPLKPEIYHRPQEEELQQRHEWQDMARQARKLMDSLPEQQKTLMLLRDVEGYGYDEIAAITGFDGNYIRVNLSRARKKMRTEMNKLEKYGTGKNEKSA
jgi:RNA polymerase sigma factor (sigma-70 family)